MLFDLLIILSSDSSQNAVNFDYINRWALNDQYRFEGLGVRPVSDSKDAVIDVNPSTLDFGAVTVGSSVTKTVTITNTGDGPLTFHLAGGGDWFSFAPADEVTLEKGQSCEVSITFRPQSISQTGTVIRVFSNASNGTQYIRCNGEGTEGTVAVPEIVDLGLSVKWASFNLGATKQEEYGDYYAWGETEPYYSSLDPLMWRPGKETGYQWESYKWCMGTDGTITKYCTYPNSGYNGFVDRKTILDMEDDVAHVNLGGKWRLPTDAEWAELHEKCSWKWTSMNGVKGQEVTGPNGESVFIPAAGEFFYNDHIGAGYYGKYLSSCLYTSFPDSAWGVYIDPDGVNEGVCGRPIGCSVRPVYVDSEQNPEIKTPEAVDLGLSSGLKWASFNLGASKPEQCGDYYAWGETEPYYSSFDPLIWKEGKEGGYSWPSYKWCNASDSMMTKYCTVSKWGFNGYTDGETTLNTEDDAAYVNLGDNWRMPTDADWTELRHDCIWEWTSQNGVSGYRVTSKSNSNSIFLPAAGYWYGYWDSTNFKDLGSVGVYWSSTLDTDFPYDAWYVYCDSGSADGYTGYPRCSGFSIRPVYDDSEQKPEIKTPEAVDLGLPSGIKWASFNLGASKPEEYGDYYAWGETEPYYSSLDPLTWKPGKEVGYEWTTYRWCNGTSDAFYKYCSDSRDGYNGYTDGKAVLDLEDDAAHVLLGGNWRMPTKEERDELYNACSRECIIKDGISGLQLTGPNGNQIFLPFSGIRYDTRLVNDGGRGYYWTSSLAYHSSLCPDEAAFRFVIEHEPWFDMYLDWDNDTNTRFMGQSIRPVYDEP